MDTTALLAFNVAMARCNSCNGVITKTDVTCFVCGEPVPGVKRDFFILRLWKTGSAKRNMRQRDGLDWLDGKKPSIQLGM